jgi:hypothetical protein
MAETILVNDRIAEGRKLLEYLVDKGLEISGACWGLSRDDGKWTFYIVCPNLETLGYRAAYMAVVMGMREIPDAEIVDEVTRLLRPDERIAKAILDYYERFPASLGKKQHHGAWLGDESFDFFYAYPPVRKATP